MSQHSPLPWKVLVDNHNVELADSQGKPLVWGEGDYTAHAVWQNGEDDIPLIVDSVNNYPRVVGALRELLDDDVYADGEGLCRVSDADSANKARELLAEIEENRV